MAGSAVVGLDCYLYYNSATHATPTWVQIAQARDVRLALSAAEADVSSRECNFKLAMQGLKEFSLEFDYLHTLGADTVFDALLASFISGTAKEFFVSDQAAATTGAQGARFGGLVFSMDRNEAMDEGVTMSFTVKPTRFIESGSLVVPDWYEVS